MTEQDYYRARLLGYSDRLSARRGEKLTFFVSAPKGSFQAEVRRLISVDGRPGAGGVKHEAVSSSLAEQYEGCEQRSSIGGFAAFTNPALQTNGLPLSLAFSFRPTVLTSKSQVLFSFNGKESSTAIRIRDRKIELVIDGRGRSLLPLNVATQNWYRLVIVVSSKEATIFAAPLNGTGGRGPVAEAVVALEDSVFFPSGFEGDVTIAAARQERDTVQHFTGKVGEIEICNSILGREHVMLMLNGVEAKMLVGTQVTSSWSMGKNVAPMTIPNDIEGGPSLSLFNLPMRAVTGSRWRGRYDRAELVPEEYNATLFHSDMVEGGDWKPSLELEVERGWRSGIYALRVHDGQDEDWIPFYVRPAADSKHARVAFLAPTATYVAYGNETNSTASIGDDLSLMKTEFIGPQDADKYVSVHPELGLSIYDNHQDGAGVAYASRLRPLLNFRPFHIHWLNNSYRHFAGDFYLIDWLEHHRFDYDVLTDDDLHLEGVASLRSYAAVITGSHPEYYSERMLDAVTEYVDSGGNLMYLGGNGFYWATSFHPDKPHVLEVRRGYTGARNWSSPPGETVHAFTGEQGGLWRNRGRSPHRLTGIGMAANGFSKAAPFKRTNTSGSSELDWIFQGVGDELIGAEGMMLGGAVGDEIDHTDYDHGTPPETVVLATSTELSTHFQPVIEYYTNMLPEQGGSKNPLVRADMTWLRRPGGGAVFSVGSICWIGCLPINGYENPVSRVTHNVLSHFVGNMV
ncbi:hypothetical protein EJ074_01400 [Mesorhizobium sp. M3A.F.Ca.ET.080.04.2.1]|uniref:N,N-dimethylformamidase beta subunit family domain-containing protein n=1 Tax=Mesorhizobium sp. M3A.F.Ca.ET.080.04.2.1 TaxID=2493676 RepID=UPI000F75F1DB|nr:N,N-dimethylformamidase beta subunit family domain-containing protein [Mesorhizobium sp. M3A.F.Ca.ET.080.04.2.1]AZO07925.1 hypothetical protein EJ074_01400 [Mesorhizobium sp. M3A.F.Ca.ET.080.04.2.1]